MGLALSLSLGLLAACGGGADGPDPFGPRRDRTGGAGDAAAALVGVWQTVLVVHVPGDLQTWTTLWRFDADGACHQTVVTESLAEGFPRTTERDCSYTTAGDEIAISYVGGGVVTYEFSFAAFSPDRLVLDGFEYERLRG